MEQCEELVYIPEDNSLRFSKYKAYYKKGGRYLYCAKKDEEFSIEGLHKVYIQEFFPQMLVRRALEQLADYLAAHRTDAAMYQCGSFWEDALQTAGRPVIPAAPYALSTHVDKGYVMIFAGEFFRKGEPVLCRYDLVQEKLYIKYRSWQREDELPPQDFVDYLFEGKQRQILAQQQLDEGVMPEPYRSAYSEICRINAFLKGKRTVRAWFDGRENGILCYPRDVQTAAFLIRLKDSRFVNYSYNYRHDEEGNVVKPKELNRLPYKLTHHSEELVLHPEVFSDLKLVE